MSSSVVELTIGSGTESSQEMSSRASRAGRSEEILHSGLIRDKWHHDSHCGLAVAAEDESSHERDGTKDAAPCPICLEENPTNHLVLHYGHRFCRSCMHSYISHATAENNKTISPRITCPCCKRSLLPGDLQAIGIACKRPAYTNSRRAISPRANSRLNRDTSSRHRGAPWLQDVSNRPEDYERSLQQAARGGLELRFCPSCVAPIQKNGGCNMVRVTLSVTELENSRVVLTIARTFSCARSLAHAVIGSRGRRLGP